MASFVPSEEAARRQMLERLGLSELEELYQDVPAAVRLKELSLPAGLSEQEAEAKLTAMAAKNKCFTDIYRGAGAYKHYIPALVRRLPGKESFLTAYTPYQAELSQGILQIIFEFQTEVSELLGLPCANASLYDGATAAAEGLNMCRDRKRSRCLMAASSDPQYIEVCRTYAEGQGAALELIPAQDGRTDLAALRAMLDKDVAGVFVPQINLFGLIEDCAEIARIIHETKALFVMGVNPIAANLLQSAGEAGADIAVAEGQPLGLPLSFGGPYIGLMACTEKLLRRMPGRIVGQTEDTEGRRAYVLTLQTREQHIRREKATSNICTNQALCALTNTCYIAAWGKEGLREVAESCCAHAHYLARRLAEIGFAPVYKDEFFHEFVTRSPLAAAELNERLAQHDILGPLPVEAEGREALLWCTTELNSKAAMDRLLDILKEAI